MAELAAETRQLDMHLEQVQDFTPTPMTVATEIYYTGYHPYTGEKVFCATRPEEKLAQRQYFFWYDRTYRSGIVSSLRRIHRPDLIQRLFPGYNPREERMQPSFDHGHPVAKGNKKNSGQRSPQRNSRKKQ